MEYADIVSFCGSLFDVQMKEFAERLPHEVSDNNSFKSLLAEADEFINTSSGRSSLELGQLGAPDRPSLAHGSSKREDNRADDHVVSADTQSSSGSSSKLPESSTTQTEGQREVIEQFEPGVYVTLLQLPNGARAFRRVKFRYKFSLINIRLLDVSRCTYKHTNCSYYHLKDFLSRFFTGALFSLTHNYL